MLLAGLLGACGPSVQPHTRGADEWDAADMPHEIDGNLDAAEARWRKEIEAERWSDDDKLLTDDPPGAPSDYGKVASSVGAKTDPPVPQTFWGRMQTGADKVGKATFAFLSVAVTLGMMVAPYLLL